MGGNIDSVGKLTPANGSNVVQVPDSTKNDKGEPSIFTKQISEGQKFDAYNPKGKGLLPFQVEPGREYELDGKMYVAVMHDNTRTCVLIPKNKELIG